MSVDQQHLQRNAPELEPHPIPWDQRKPESVNIGLFAAKYRSKREVYRFVSYECKIFVPSLETVTMAHLSDLISNKKMCVYQS